MYMGCNVQQQTVLKKTMGHVSAEALSHQNVKLMKYVILRKELDPVERMITADLVSC
jgi:hypothetical protein